MKRLFVIVLVGCSEKHTKKEPEFKKKESIKKNHVVIQKLSDKGQELLQGSSKAKYLIPMLLSWMM